MAWHVGHSASTPGHHSSPLFIPPPVGAVQGGDPLGFDDPRSRCVSIFGNARIVHDLTSKRVRPCAEVAVNRQ
jgi:hypothetical protein